MVLDDLMCEGSDDHRVLDLLTRDSHHRGINVIFMTQDMFLKGKHAKTISRNAHYIIAFKNPRDQLGVRILTQQAFPQDFKDVLNVYRDATERPYRYLMFDLHPNLSDSERLKTNLLRDEGYTTVYQKNERYTSVSEKETMSSNPVISSPSSFNNMSRAELDLVAQAAAASGFNPYDILYGSPPNTNSPPLGLRTSTPAGTSVASDLSFKAQFSPFIPPTPSPTPRRGQRQPPSSLNLTREQVRAQGINPMEFMAQPLREAGTRGGVGPIVVPPYTPPSPIPSSLEFSSPRIVGGTPSYNTTCQR